jgi:hypothetical protein
MNNSKKLFEGINKLKEDRKRGLQNFNLVNVEQKANFIINHEDKIFKLRRIVKDIHEGDDIIKFYEENDTLFHIRSLKINQVLRVYERGNDFKFIRITKINKKSFKYDIIKICENRVVIIAKDKVLKFKDGEYYEDLTRKNILFYNTSNLTTQRIFNKLTEGEEFIPHQYLQITL